MKTIFKLLYYPLTLILFCFMTFLHSPMEGKAAYDGGIVVVAEGLIDQNIELYLPSNTFKQGNADFVFSLIDATGKTIYTMNSANTYVQFPNLKLAKGVYRLEVTYEGMVEWADFEKM